jgi:hypothetical protein
MGAGARLTATDDLALDVPFAEDGEEEGQGVDYGDC